MESPGDEAVAAPAGPRERLAALWRDRAQLKERLLALGQVGLVVHFSIFFLCIAAFWFGLEEGVVQRVSWLAERLPEDGASLVVAYGLAKVLTLPRLALTVTITPPIQAWWARRGAV